MNTKNTTSIRLEDCAESIVDYSGVLATDDWFRHLFQKTKELDDGAVFDRYPISFNPKIEDRNRIYFDTWNRRCLQEDIEKGMDYSVRRGFVILPGEDPKNIKSPQLQSVRVRFDLRPFRSSNKYANDARGTMRALETHKNIMGGMLACLRRSCE